MNNHLGTLQPITDQRLNKEIAKIILTTQEKERFEVGKELHDNVCQMLATVKLYLDTGLKDDDYLKEFVSLGKDMLMKSLEELRRISKSWDCFPLRSRWETLSIPFMLRGRRSTWTSMGLTRR
jgi:signal transduction histidine kinase